MLDRNHIYTLDCRDGLRQLDDGSVDCVVTSPPYWSLRDYGIEPQLWGGKSDCEHEWQDCGNGYTCARCGAWKGCLGLEPTVDIYLEHLLDIFDEVKRVLKPTGTCWVNLGDNYTDKSLNMVPYRFALGMQQRGWILRNIIVWAKSNCMPSSIKDRCTVDFEPMFFFVKSPRYYFKPQFDPWADERMGRDGAAAESERNVGGRTDGFTKPNNIDPSHNPGKLRRCVWTISTVPLQKGYEQERHFASFPPALVERPITAGCPERVCADCGKAERVVLRRSGEAFNIRVCDVKEGRLKYTDRVASESEVAAYDEQHYERESGEYVVSDGCGCGFDEDYWYRFILGPAHANRHHKEALAVLREWMTRNNCYDYVRFYEWYCQQKKGTWASGTMEEGQAAKMQGELPFPSPEKRLPGQVGTEPGCACGKSFVPGLVLDPFVGSGTTCMVARQLGRDYLGFDLKGEYIEIAERRMAPVTANRRLGEW